jgi:hypothetical protein
MGQKGREVNRIEALPAGQRHLTGATDAHSPSVIAQGYRGKRIDAVRRVLVCHLAAIAGRYTFHSE